jgi:queuine tRNA-ribosyltransferase catalytic subunit
MPVATQASLKGLTPEQLAQTDCRLCLNNAYHLGLKPGQAVLNQLGGAHRLQAWDKNILTDSGGWVLIVSKLLSLAQNKKKTKQSRIRQLHKTYHSIGGISAFIVKC